MRSHRTLRVPSRATRVAGTCAALALAAAAPVRAGQGAPTFERVATFPAYLNSEEGARTAAEILTASADGTLVLYADSSMDAIGFVDLTDPAQPRPGGFLPVPGEPTSIAVAGRHALAVVSTRADHVTPTGVLLVVDLARRAVVHSIQLGGQPDSIAVSPDGRYAAVAIENERDEGLADGELPQAPPGYLVIVDLVDEPARWKTRVVLFQGLPMLHPDDPEPEFVDINAANVAAVTFQENNHVALVDLATGRVTGSFSAGIVDVTGVGTKRDGRLELSGSLQGVPREPDAVAWISRDALATANEGDYHGGSRGFTIWSTSGEVLYDSGAELEQVAARIGRYPLDRAKKKGVEPEGVEFGVFGGTPYLFVGAERASVVYAYRLERVDGARPWRPVLEAALPTGTGPEGLLALPGRGLLLVGCEVDEAAAGVRGGIDVFRRAAPGDATGDKPGGDGR